MWHLLLISASLGAAAAQAVQPCDIEDYSFAYCLPLEGLGPGNNGFIFGDDGTLEGCARFCEQQKYNYFLYQYQRPGAGDCFCSPSILAVDPVDPARCNIPCPGNPDQICGGDGVGSLYVNNCFEPNPNTAGVGRFGYLGCLDGVVDDTFSTPIGAIVNAGESASLEQCRSRCEDELFLDDGYFALQRSDLNGSPGARCACGANLNPERYEAADSRCTAPCPSGGGFCGNPTNGVNVYSLSAAAFVATTRSCTSLVTTVTSSPVLLTTVTDTSTTTTTVNQSPVTSTCATSTATATQASTVTASTTVTVTKPKTSTCYKTVTRTITSTCRPPKTRYARDSDHVSIFARQNADVETCTVSNGEVTTTTVDESTSTSTSTTTRTITATRPADVICNTATSTITVTNPTTTTTTATVTNKGKVITITKKKTVTTTKYPRHAPTCKKKKNGGYY